MARGFSAHRLRGLSVISALLAVALASAAGAQTDCTDPVTQVDLNTCAGLAQDQADAALNAAWPGAKAAADASGAGDLLLDAQRKWLAYRDAACAAEAAPYQGGSIQPLIHAQCLTRLTEGRIKDLGMFDGH